MKQVEAVAGGCVSWQVVADFDGTVTLRDATTALLDRFALPEWRAIEAAWEVGAIGSAECMGRQVATIRAGVTEFDALVARTAVDPFFVSFVADCRRRGIPITIVSDGLDRVIAAVLSRLGLGELPVVANRLVFAGRRRWLLGFPHARDDCRVASGTCKCAAARVRPAVRTIVIGDGRSDLCVAAGADYVFAKDQLLALCRAHGIPHRPFATFEDAIRLLADLVDDDAASPIEGGIEETTHA